MNAHTCACACRGQRSTLGIAPRSRFCHWDAGLARPAGSTALGAPRTPSRSAFYKPAGIKLRSLCLHGNHFTDLAPWSLHNLKKCIYLFLFYGYGGLFFQHVCLVYHSTHESQERVSVGVLITVTKHQDQKVSLEGKGLFGLHFSITERNQDRNSNRAGT